MRIRAQVGEGGDGRSRALRIPRNKLETGVSVAESREKVVGVPEDFRKSVFGSRFNAKTNIKPDGGWGRRRISGLDIKTES